MVAKTRADVLLVELGLAPSREKAQAMIMAGLVYLGEKRVEKPGKELAPDSELQVRGNPCPYVSRGGLKLEAALEAFGVDPAGKTCADIGSSTGGFTHCLLLRGARRVYAVDVGKGLMDAGLRADPRVVLMEGVNARYLEKGDFPEPVELLVADASFISLKLLFPAIRRAAPGAEVIALVKPQFEVGRGQVGRGGIVRDDAKRAGALDAVMASAAEAGLAPGGWIESPVRGAKGNIEFLLHIPAPPLQERQPML